MGCWPHGSGVQTMQRSKCQRQWTCPCERTDESYPGYLKLSTWILIDGNGNKKAPEHPEAFLRKTTQMSILR